MKIQPWLQTRQRILEIVEQDTGRRLSETGAAEVERILQQLGGTARPPDLGQEFKSAKVTILLADLRGFTAITAGQPQGVAINLLNPWLIRMSAIIARHQGNIDKFMGDSIMVLFDAKVGQQENASRALTCAVEMQIAMEALNLQQMGLGLPKLFMGIGINTGTVLAGILGSEHHYEYTVIGDEVNRAARIEAFSLRGQVLISQSTYELSKDFLETSHVMNIHVKGEPLALNLREVIGIPSLGLKVPRLENRRSHRVEVKSPLSYQQILGGIVLPARHHGIIHDLGYHGVLIEVEEELPSYSEIKLSFDLPLVDFQARDIYAKVVSNKVLEGRILLGVEFTSLPGEANLKIQLFVQLRVFIDRL